MVIGQPTHFIPFIIKRLTVSLFDTYISILNPDKVNPISGAENNRKFFESQGITPGIDNVIGPTLVASGAKFPKIDNTAIIPFDSLLIHGETDVGARVMLRRQSKITNAKISEGVLAMDYVRVNDGATLERGAAIAHGSEVGAHATMEEFSFANIVVDIGKNSRVRKDTVLTPGVIVPEGIDTMSNMFYVGRGIDSRIPNGIKVDPETMRPTEGQEGWFGKSFPRFLGVDENGNKFDPATDTRVPNFLGKRFNTDPDKLTPGNTYRDLSDVGYQGWMQDVLKVEQHHNPTFANWLDNYVSVIQFTKNLTYVQSDAQAIGQIAWHAPVMQSEVMALHTASQVLDAQGKNIPELQTLIKGQLTLLGAYSPDEKEKAKIDVLYEQPEKINKLLDQVSKEISSTKTTVKLFPQWTIEAIGKDSYANKEKVDVVINENDIARLKDVIGTMKERLTAELESVEPIVLNKKKEKGTKSTAANELDNAERLRDSLNPEHIDISLIADGVRVRRLHGAVPSVHPGAVLVGNKENIDLGGAVVIGNNATLVDTTARSEQLSVPVYVEKNAVICKAGLHTAAREQHPCLIREEAVITASDGEKSWVHGAEINPKTLVFSATVGDEARLSGVAVKWTVFGSSVKPEWGVYAGNTAAVGTWEAGKTFKDLPNKQYNLRTASAVSSADTELQEWLPTSPLKDADIKNQQSVETAVTKYAEQLRSEAKELLNEKIDKYGPIYKHSAHLQIANLNLGLAKDILEGAGKLDDKTNNYINNLQSAVDYLLGRKQEINSSAAVVLAGIGKQNSPLQKLQKDLLEIAESHETISIKEWQNKPGTFSFDDAKSLAESNLHPLRNDTHRKYSYPNRKHNQVHKNEDFVITGEQELQNRMHETITLGSKHVEEVAKDLGRIKELFENISRHLNSGIQEKDEHSSHRGSYI